MGIKILAVDSSTTVAGIAVSENDKILAELNINNIKNHSTRLVPLIKVILDELALKVSDFDCFAVSLGPGSFTGLRIGMTTMKTIAYVAKKPIIGVTTLDMLSFNGILFSGFICPIMDARNKQVYTAIYKNDNGKNTRISDYMGIKIEELADMLIEKNENVLLIGDAVVLHQEYFKHKLGDKLYIAPSNINSLNASILSVMSYERFKNNNYDNPLELKPFYLRKSQAERLREEKKYDKSG